MSFPKHLQLRLKSLVFPGVDLNTRCRARFLPAFFTAGPVETLDAGCGNGALSLPAYRMGNRVLGITLDNDQIQRNRDLFAMRGTDPDRLQFEICNLYDLHKLDRKFDQIICSETIEHISRDQEVVAAFHSILNPGGVLHLCAPNALHPRYHQGLVNGPENGGHVRDGYTFETYRALLEPVGFRVVDQAGLGTPWLLTLDRSVRSIRNKFGNLAAMPMFFLVWPLTFFDHLNPKVPLSLYVKAVRT
jgi:cyclopropane fatty-acyl-phospholipid synthase-like methyltransferase